jgi:hypothetical protein
MLPGASTSTRDLGTHQIGLVVGSFDEFAILEPGAGADERDEVRRLLRGSNWPVVAWPIPRGAPIPAGPAGLTAVGMNWPWWAFDQTAGSGANSRTC